MSLRIEEGFCEAQSNNLPRVDSIMILEFFRDNDCFSGSEIRGVKEQSSGRESYGDVAVGYVQVKRVDNVCVVKCRICPEHRVKAKNYNVVVEVDENNSKVIKAQCLDCAASAGGCKHSVAVLMWIHRRSEEPAPTEVQCYWKKSRLSMVGTSLKFLTVNAFGGIPVQQTQINFVETVVNLGIQNGSSSEFFKFYNPSKFDSLSIYQLTLRFADNNGTDYDSFVEFCTEHMNKSLCGEAARNTLRQAEDNLWHQLRFGRITASKLYAAAHCKTEDGSFVKHILGVVKLRDTIAMERGRKLEGQVLKVLEKSLGKKFTRIGISLSNEHPIFGASPDAVYDDHVVEVKCPSSDENVKNYLTIDNKVTAKYRAQIQLQMHFLKKSRCIFAVADPMFEENGKVNCVSVCYDKEYVKTVMCDAEEFWEKYIFPVLLESAKK